MFNSVIDNPGQSSPSLTSLVPLSFVIIPLVFFYLCKVFSGFLQFKGVFVDGQNNSKSREVVPLIEHFLPFCVLTETGVKFSEKFYYVFQSDKNVVKIINRMLLTMVRLPAGLLFCS